MDNFEKTKIFINGEKKRKYNQTYVPSNDYNWIVKNSNLGFLPLTKEIPYNDIFDEIKAIDHLLVLHREDEGRGWYSFCIHGKSYDATRGDEYYNDDRPHVWTKEAVSFMPNTVKFFKDNWFGNEFFRIRIMKLVPGGMIAYHQDNELPGALGAINIAINNPEGTYFAMKNHGIVPFEPGLAIMLNIANPHAVINTSNLPRYHIIVHHKKITNDFEKMIVTSYNNFITR